MKLLLKNLIKKICIKQDLKQIIVSNIFFESFNSSNSKIITLEKN